MDTAQTAQTDRRPLELYFWPDAYEQFCAIKKMGKMSSNAEVVSRALHVQEWLMKQLADGQSIGLVNGDTICEGRLRSPAGLRHEHHGGDRTGQLILLKAVQGRLVLEYDKHLESPDAGLEADRCVVD